MRLALLLLLAGCTARQECAATCKGCCDLQGRCHEGSDPYACGGAGDCDVCLAGQACSRDAGCLGTEAGSVLQLTGNNVYVPVSAQGFTWASTGSPFVVLSNRVRQVCRDPGIPPNVDEEVLIVSSRGEGHPELERVTFWDGGIDRRPVIGGVTIRSQDARVLSSIDIDTEMKLKGTIDAPMCGAFH